MRSKSFAASLRSYATVQRWWMGESRQKDACYHERMHSITLGFWLSKDLLDSHDKRYHNMALQRHQLWPAPLCRSSGLFSLAPHMCFYSMPQCARRTKSHSMVKGDTQWGSQADKMLTMLNRHRIKLNSIFICLRFSSLLHGNTVKRVFLIIPY